MELAKKFAEQDLAVLEGKELCREPDLLVARIKALVQQAGLKLPDIGATEVKLQTLAARHHREVAKVMLEELRGGKFTDENSRFTAFLRVCELRSRLKRAGGIHPEVIGTSDVELDKFHLPPAEDVVS